MKTFTKTFVFTIYIIIYSVSNAQNYYWVNFKDKDTAYFNPYDFFDRKAIERRQKHNLPLYDYSDIPINTAYLQAVEENSIEVIGFSRWFNAAAISANNEQIEIIRNFDFVKSIEDVYLSNTQILCDNLQNAFHNKNEESLDFIDENDEFYFLGQITRMQGEFFENAGITGKGVRIAVFDGGFPSVDKHAAFKHLFDNNRIIKTYNFPRKIENVYGWNSHGTMVLSCIAGRYKNKNLGMATDAEFLLARTEVGLEPFKEEVWWLMAAEWADQNGADIISSSLGYGIDRYKTSEMDGKTSLVARAASIASSKGILVVNSIGNEANRKTWKTLITPADVDSVLSVGGIDPETNVNIDFTSLGPTADGRLKPNVSAFGKVTAATPVKDNNSAKFSTVYGTSFSCPLVSGFAACVLQINPKLTNMQLKTEIEKSADMYPYFDYAIGYGVPQASYFISPNNSKPQKSFYFYNDKNFIHIIAAGKSSKEENTLFYHIQKPDGKLLFYGNLSSNSNKSSTLLSIPKSDLDENFVIRILYKGYIDSLLITQETFKSFDTNITSGNTVLIDSDMSKIQTSKWGTYSKYTIEILYGFKFPVSLSGDYPTKSFKTNNFNLSLQFMTYATKWYWIGLTTAYNSDVYHYLNYNTTIPGTTFIADKNYSKHNNFYFDVFQRFRIVSGGLNGHGFFIGVGGFFEYNYKSKFINKYQIGSTEITAVDSNPDINSLIRYGLFGELGFDFFSMKFNYRLNDIFVENMKLSKLYVGFDLRIPLSF